MLSCCTARTAGWFIHGNVQVWNNHAYNETELADAKAALEAGEAVPDGCDPDMLSIAKNYLIFIYCLPAILCCLRALPPLSMSPDIPPAGPLTEPCMCPAPARSVFPHVLLPDLHEVCGTQGRLGGRVRGCGRQVVGQRGLADPLTPGARELQQRRARRRAITTHHLCRDHLCRSCTHHIFALRLSVSVACCCAI